MTHFTETDHTCTEATCPFGSYYVTAVDGASWWKMAGPYDTHGEALAAVRFVYELTCKHDRSRAGLMTQDLLAGTL